MGESGPHQRLTLAEARSGQSTVTITTVCETIGRKGVSEEGQVRAGRGGAGPAPAPRLVDVMGSIGVARPTGARTHSLEARPAMFAAWLPSTNSTSSTSGIGQLILANRRRYAGQVGADPADEGTTTGIDRRAVPRCRRQPPPPSAQKRSVTAGLLTFCSGGASRVASSTYRAKGAGQSTTLAVQVTTCRVSAFLPGWCPLPVTLLCRRRRDSS
jgi:hypothetical protein